MFSRPMRPGRETRLNFCGDILIPSIFPLFGAFRIRGEIRGLQSPFRPLNPVTRRLFRLPGGAGATVLIGLVGATLPAPGGENPLLDAGNHPKAGPPAALLYRGAGPAFVISVAGSGLLGSTQAGVILFVSQITAALSLGSSSGFSQRKRAGPKRMVPQPGPPLRAEETKQAPAMPVSSALVEAAAEGASSMISMCSFAIPLFRPAGDYGSKRRFRFPQPAVFPLWACRTVSPPPLRRYCWR